MSAGKRLNVQIGFNADTKNLKTSLNDLFKQLDKVASTKIVIDDGSMKNAVKSAKDLQKYLAMSTDSRTGNLDLSKFSQTLKSAGTDVNKLSTDLLGMGRQGNQAFLQLARTMSQAQVPMKKTNTLMSELWITMKNTARWQLSSSLLHGFMGSIQSAVGYTKDLNESLNNIRIVTGASNDRMKEFADNANKAAKALNTTTTEYTNASLIYYQQGDSDALTKTKTDITVQASNVARTSTEEMSEYLTAVWNSYKAGEDTLEAFVDKMAAVGAATASSLQEISTAMSKVAATANVVGVNFDQLTSIIATVSSVTRDAPESVGTAYKTIFARIGDLKIGEKDEDGVGLGTVSSDLKSVGIEILNAEGELRDMGTVVEEIGGKWGTWDRGMQTAIAQAIAGKRQYTQLIALFENWDKYQSTMAVSQGADGTLAGQADIYAESWEASTKQVKASLEDVYDSLINDDFAIGLNKGFSSLIDGVGSAIDSMGGVQTILLTIGSLVTKIFAKDISEGVSNMIQNMRVQLGLAAKDMDRMQSDASDTLNSEVNSPGSRFTSGEKIEAAAIDSAIKARQKLTQVSENLSEAELAEAQRHMEKIDNLSKETQALGQNITAKQDAVREAEVAARTALVKDAGNDPELNTEQKKEKKQKASTDFSKNKKIIKEDAEAFRQAAKASDEFNDQFELMLDQADNTGNMNALEDSLNRYGASLKEGSNEALAFNQAMAANEGVVRDQIEAVKEAMDAERLRAQAQMEDSLAIAAGEMRNEEGQIIQEADPARLAALQAIVDAQMASGDAADEAAEAQRRLNEAVDGMPLEHVMSMTEKMSNMVSVATGVYAVISQIQGLGSIWSDKDTTVAEKLIATFTTLAMVIPTVVTMIGSLRAIHAASAAATTADTAAHGLHALALTILNPIIAKYNIFTAWATAATSGWAVAINAAIWPLTLIVAAIAAVIAITVALSKAEEENRKASIEENKALVEQAEKTKELTLATRDLISAYDDLLARKKAGEDVDEELAQSADALGKQYGIEGAALAQLTGDYDNFTEAVKKAQEQQLKDSKGSLTTGVDAAKENIKLAIASTNQYQTVERNEDGTLKIDDRGYTITKQVSNIDTGFSQGDEKEAYNAGKSLKKYSNSEDDKFNFDIGQTVEEQVAFYEDLEKGIQEIEAAGATKDSEYYDSLVSLRDEMFVAVEDYQSLSTELKAVNDEFDIITLGESVVDKEVNSMEEFIAVRQGMLDKLKEQNQEELANGSVTEEQLTAKVDGYLGQFERLNDYTFNFTGIKELSSELTSSFNKSETEINDKLLKFYDELAKTGQTDLFWHINWQISDLDADDVRKAIGPQLEMIEAQAAQAKAKTQVSQVENAKGNWSEDMSGESMEELRDSMNWGDAEAGVIAFSEFLKLSSVDQENYLNALLASSQSMIVTSLEAKKIAAEKILADSEVKLNEDRLNELIQQKAQYDKLLEYNEAYLEAKANNDTAGIEKAEEGFKKLAEKMNLSEGFEAPGENIAESIAGNLEGINAEFNIQQGLQDAVNQIEDADIQLVIEAKLKEDSVALALQGVADAWDDSVDQINEGVDEVFSAFEAMAKGIKKVTKGVDDQGNDIANAILLSADAAETVAEIYPEMLVGAEVWADGTIQLSDQVAQAYMSNDEDIVTAALEAKIAELEADNVVLLAKRESLKGLLDAFVAAAEAQVAVDNQETEIRIKNSNTMAEAFILNGMDEATAYLLQKEAMANNDKEFTRVFVEYAMKQGLSMEDASDAADKAWAKMSQNAVINIDDITATVHQLAAAIKAAPSGEQAGSANNVGGTAGGIGGSNVSAQEIDAAFQGTTFNYQGKPYKASDYIKAMEVNLSGIDQAYAANLSAISKLRAGNTKYQSGGYNDKDKGGGKDKDNKKELEKLSEEAERLHEINMLLEIQQHNLSMLSKAKSRVYGANYIKAIEKEIKALEREQELLAQKADALSLFVAIDQQNAADIGANIGGDGSISNFSALVNQWIDELEAATDKYNAGAQEDADKDAYDAAKELYEERLQILETYEKSFADYLKLIEEEADAFDEWQAANMEKITKTYEFKIEINDEDLKILDYYQNKFDEDFFQTSESLGLNGMFGEASIDNLEIYGDKINELQRAYSDGDINQAQFIEGLKESEDGIIAQLTALSDLIKVMSTAYQDALEGASDELSKFTDMLEQTSSIMSSYSDIYQLVFGEEAYGGMKKFYEAQTAMAMDSVKVTKATYDMFEGQFNMAVALFGADSKEAKAAQASMLQAQQDMLESVQEYLEVIRSEYENNINAIADDIEKRFLKLAGTAATSIEELRQSYDKWTESEERYLTTANRLYETTKLSTSIQKDIDAATSSSSKKKLKALQDEIELQKQNKNLTQYDIDMLNAKYELTKAQIELEDAQNTKNQVRLVRDDEGNYKYQYTADPTKVQDAEQKYQDALKSINDLALERVKELENSFLEAEEAYLEELKNIWNDQTTTEAEKLAKQEELNKQFYETVRFIQEQYNIAAEDLAQSNYDMVLKFTGDENLANEARAESYNETIKSMILDSDELKVFVDEASVAMQQAFKDYQDKVKEAEEETGINFENMQEDIDKTRETSEELADFIKGEFMDALNDELNAIADQVDQWKEYEDQIRDVIRAYEEMLRTLNQEIKDEIEKPSVPDKPEAPPSSGGGGKPSGGGSGGGGDGNPSIGDMVTYNGGTYYSDSYGRSPLGSRGPGRKVKITNTNSGAPYPIHVYSSDSAYGWLKQSQISGYDTGGYTGDWGSTDGKLAFLHQKELVLNAGDTQNILDTVKLLDSSIISLIGKMLTSNAVASAGLLSSGLQSTSTTPVNGSLDQNVKIEASFPGVTQSNEIEIALRNLVNDASQFISKKTL